jgi:Spy/CpxP family protein refolding chaperone
MKTIAIGAVCLVVGLAGGAAGASFAPALLGGAHGGHGANQPYRDEQGRPITSLSAEDVEQLEAGAGWGLAKPAEFNGYPGPAHVLEFTDELGLTEEQLTGIQASFASMQARAKTLGTDLIEAEKALDGAFIDGIVTPGILQTRLEAVEAVRADLRQTHLAAHLEVTPLLTNEQREKYDELRGYGGHSGH